MTAFGSGDEPLRGPGRVQRDPRGRRLALPSPATAGDHPFGAYFTTLPRGTRNLAQRLRIPKSKLQYVFEFTDAGDLTPLPGGRGQFIFYSPNVYEVEPSRQGYEGVT
jgi:hypothetical protein